MQAHTQAFLFLSVLQMAVYQAWRLLHVVQLLCVVGMPAGALCITQSCLTTTLYAVPPPPLRYTHLFAPISRASSTATLAPGLPLKDTVHSPCSN